MHEHKRFDDEAATWDDAPGHEERQVAVAQAIEEAVTLSPRMRALEVGGGTGRLSILLSDRVGSVVMTDPSAGMMQVARQRIRAAQLGDRLRAVQADLTTDPVDGAYDVMWSSMALHHVQDLDALLRSVAGLLVNGGRLAIADLDEDRDGTFHAEKVDFDGHHGFDRQRLAGQLALAGFADVSFVDATTILKGDRELGVFFMHGDQERISRAEIAERDKGQRVTAGPEGLPGPTPEIVRSYRSTATCRTRPRDRPPTRPCFLRWSMSSSTDHRHRRC